MGNKKTLKMKLLIDTERNRVLYAEAGKDVVDFLFGLLALPLGSIVKLLIRNNNNNNNDHQMVGSIGSIYSSLESLDLTYMEPNRDKKILLNPKGGQNSQDHNFLLPAAPSPPKHNRYFRCHPSGEYSSSYGSCSMYFTDAYGGSCPCCKRQMMTEIKRVDYRELLAISNKEVVGGEQEGASYVKGVITYTVMDDLSVMPMSTISTISMLNKFGVKNVNLLKEENVSLGLDKALKLLKASFESKTVLTDVFLN